MNLNNISIHRHVKKSESSALLLGILFALCSLMSYVLLREFQGFAGHLLLCLKAFFFFCLLAIQISALNSTKYSIAYKSLIASIVILEPVLAVYLPNLVFFIIGFFSILATCHLFNRQVKFSLSVKSCVILSFFALFLQLTLNTYISDFSGYSLPIYTEELLASGFLHKDYFYQISVTAMIRSFHTVSTGVHGLNQINSHILSNFWFAGMANLLGTSALLSHVIAKFIIAIPLLFFSFFFVLEMRFKKLHDSKLLFIISIFVIELLLITSISLALYLSEAYIFGAIVACFALAILFDKDHLSLNIKSLIALITICGICIFFKAHIALYLVILLVLRLNYPVATKKKYLLIIALLIFLLFAFWFIFKNNIVIYLSDIHPAIFPIDFPETSFFFLYSVLAVCILSRFKLQHIKRFKIISIVLGICFTALFLLMRNIADGQGHLFSIILFIHTTFLLASMNLVARINKFTKGRYFSNIQGLCLIFLIVLLFTRGTVIVSQYLQLTELVHVQQKSQANTLFKDLNKVFVNSDSDSLYYAAPDEHLFWSLITDCSAKPFLIPAAFEKVRLYGLPPAGFCWFYRLGYGFQSIGDKRTIPLGMLELCNEAVNLGFPSITKITYKKNQGFSLQRQQCLFTGK